MSIGLGPDQAQQSNMKAISTKEGISHYRPPDKSQLSKINFLFLNQNICCGYSKEQSQ